MDMDENTKQSADDALEPESDIYDPADKSHKASRDEPPPPASPPTDTSHKKLPADDPRLDPASDLDQQEVYDEGLTSAAEADTWEESDHDLEKPVEKY